MADALITTRCCVVGGGPAGLMAGFLLARAGVDVVVMEKHRDFLRDFRGDTIHPSTLELMNELGLLDKFLQLPHQKVTRIGGEIGNETLPVADFSHLPTRCRFIAMMPQWDFLDFIAREAAKYPSFKLMMQTEAEDLIERDGTTVGVRATSPEGTVEVRGLLVIAADGRRSILREQAGLRVRELGAPMDVLWFRLPRRPGDPEETSGRFDPGRIFIRINRGDYWQCAYVIPKDGFAEVQGRGLPAFRAGVAAAMPFAADRLGAIASWDGVKLLTVQVDRLETWYKPGLLCIGDAAHAMSPMGGVGVNLAVQDAVAAANILARPLREGRVGLDDLAQVQTRRAWPARVTQALQVLAQNRVISPTLAAKGELKVPFLLRVLSRFPVLQRLPGRLIGLGVRPEHVEPQPAA